RRIYLLNYFLKTNATHSFLAIIPHHNTLAELENIQKKTPSIGIPFCPIICPICSVCKKTLTDTKNLKKQIQMAQKKLHQYKLSIRKPELIQQNTKNQRETEQYKLVCNVDGLDSFLEADDVSFLEPLQLNAFTLRYAGSKKNIQNAIKEHSTSQLTMRIYRIGLITLKNIDSSFVEKSAIGITWTLSNDIWVKQK
ncbi:MAG TPA: hypothetical protein VFC68_01510, partial [Treponemataceae bacterium]|nr:hypothetical protein [Treponemataceae bacterium]